MDQLLTFEFEEVQNSIITPGSVYYGDYLQPYSFLEFLKNTNNNYTPKVYNEFYIDYLKKWAAAKNDFVLTETQVINSQYADLLREITLTYSTLQERRFLSNIDFSDPEDLEIAIPFFSRKIKEIVLLYKSSRDKVTFQIEKNKRRGTESSIQLALRENIVKYLTISDRFQTLNIAASSVNANINVQIDELIDTYGNYFDLTNPPSPDYGYGGNLRETFYTANTNDIDYTDFVDLTEYLKKRVFSSLFIEQLGKNFTINANITYDPICDPTNPIGEFLEEKTVSGITPEQYRELRASLIRKFIGVDYYYILKNEFGEVTSGLLFKADNPSGNLLNQSNASTATVVSDELKSLRKIGLYFAPDKQGVVRLNKTTNTYGINIDNLTPNVTYVYPSPEDYGKNYGADYPIVFYYDTTSITNKDPNSNTFGDPIKGPRTQNFNAYYSRQQTYETEDINKNALQSSFSPLVNAGYLYDWKQDIYGNEYGVIKDKYGQYFKSTFAFSDIVDTGTTVKLLPFNGWLLNDPLSGANFDYDESGIYDGFDGVVRSGITLSGGDFSHTAVNQYLNFRQFYPYQGISNSYNLYPAFSPLSLLRIVPVDGSQTELSTISGNTLPKLLTEKQALSGIIYVKNVITGNVSTLSSALTATFDKYSQSIKNQLYGDVKTFDLFYDTIAVKTSNYLVFDKISFNNTGFIKPTTVNISLSVNTYNPFENVSNLFFDTSKNLILFYKTAVYNDYQYDNGRIIYPEIYKFDIDKHELVKIFPSLSTTINSISSNFSFANILSTLNIVEVGSQKISHNKVSNLYVINYIGYDSNGSPYLFDHKFTYNGEDIAFKYSNIYNTNTYKEVSNFYSLSDDGNIFINRIAGNKALYYTSFNFSFSATSFGGIIINNDSGYVQL